MHLSLRAITVATFVTVAPLCGCTTNAVVGTNAWANVPKDAQTTCANHCSSIGMALDSVVIMASNVGCVCRGAKGGAQTSESGAAPAGGMAALIVAEQQRQQQQRQQQSSYR